MIGETLLPALLHESLIIGFSAWSRSPSMAGAAYAGVYFGLLIIMAIIGGGIMMRNVKPGGDRIPALTVTNLSVSGIVNGVAAHLYDVDASILGGQGRRRRSEPMIPGLEESPQDKERPALAPLLMLGGAFVLLPLLAARTRIQAVEVVRG